MATSGAFPGNIPLDVPVKRILGNYGSSCWDFAVPAETPPPAVVSKRGPQSFSATQRTAFFGLYNTHSKAQADPRTWVHAIHLGDSPLNGGKEGKPALYLRTHAMCRDLLRQFGVPPGFIHGGSDCQGTHVLAGSPLMLADSEPLGLNSLVPVGFCYAVLVRESEVTRHHIP